MRFAVIPDPDRQGEYLGAIFDKEGEDAEPLFTFPDYCAGLEPIRDLCSNGLITEDQKARLLHEVKGSILPMGEL